MRLSWLIGLVVTLLVSSTLVSAEEPREPAEKPVLVNAKLVGIRVRDTRNYVIGVKFATQGKKPQEIIIEFPVGQSNTPHRYTLKAVLEACIPAGAFGKEDWVAPALEAEFSIPQGGIGKRGEGLEHISVLTLKLKAK